MNSHSFRLVPCSPVITGTGITMRAIRRSSMAAFAF